MELSIAGVLVCLTLWLLGYALGAPLIIGLFGSFAFGSTAVASLGTSTIPIHIVFAGALLIALAPRANFPSSLTAVLASQPIAQLTCALVAYAAATAYILPRLFAHDATIVVPIDSTMVELPLQPVAGNFNQTGYILLNGLLFLAFAVLLHWKREGDIRRAFLTWASLQALLGLIDLVSKTAGLGDILDPVRTSGYANLADHGLAGFWRVVGAFPEASAYAAVALQALAFALVDWRLTRSRLSLLVSLTLCLLLALSTSGTGYVGFAGLLLCLILLALAWRMRGRILFDHVAWLGVALAVLVVVLALYIYDEDLFDPWVAMLLDATLNKPASESGLERAYWNRLSIEAFLNTQGIGVGLGSTRSSSWAISVLAQLGVLGAIGFAVAVGALVLGLVHLDDRRHGSLPASASMAALVGVFASCFGGSGADPGTIFFIALAIVSAHLGASEKPALSVPDASASR
jgi:O-Antigen ligase